jgi:hypothetical protein
MESTHEHTLLAQAEILQAEQAVGLARRTADRYWA